MAISFPGLFLLHLLAQRFEALAKDFIGLEHGDKGVGVDAVYVFLEEVHLAGTEDGEDDLFFGMVVHPFAMQEGAAPFEVVDDAVADFRVFVGDDEEGFIIAEAVEGEIDDTADDKNGDETEEGDPPIAEDQQAA